MYCKDCGNFWEECNCDEADEQGLSDTNALLCAAIERIKSSMDERIPWEHEVYKQADGCSPKMKFDGDCYIVALHHVRST